MTKINNILAALLVVALGVNLQAKVMESSVATVNGQPILASEYDTRLKVAIEQYQANAPKVLERPYAKDILGKRILQDLIFEELLYQAAIKAGIKVTDSELEQALAEAKIPFGIDEKSRLTWHI